MTNRIEAAVTAHVAEVTPLELDHASMPVATPWAVAGVVVGAAALGYQVGYHLGGSVEDDLDAELASPARLAEGASSTELLDTRAALNTAH